MGNPSINMTTVPALRFRSSPWRHSVNPSLASDLAYFLRRTPTVRRGPLRVLALVLVR